MQTISRLTGAAYGVHLSDQVALVSVPLIAALAFDASPELIGVLVACQSSAHLIGSIPFGILVDQARLRLLMIWSALLLLVGAVGATVSVPLGFTFGFGASVTIAGFGTVLFGLTALSIVPRVADAASLSSANAAIEVPRALCSFAVPLAVGLAIGDVPARVIFAAAALGAGIALISAVSLPEFEPAPKPASPILSRIVKGGRYVVGHALLLPISLCAIFWNLAFAALLVALVPVIQDVYSFDPGAFGIALAAFGIGAFAGTSLARRIADRVAPKVVLLFGPGSSAAAAGCLLLIGPDTPIVFLYACFFVLGFGPSMWLIAQNSVRQLVSPPAMLGRVNAVIQTAIYGVRPLGALLGGLVAGTAGPQAALLLVVAAFGASFAVSLLSKLRSVESYASLQSPASLS